MLTDSLRVALTGDAQECIRLLAALQSLPGSRAVHCCAIATKQRNDRGLRNALQHYRPEPPLYLRVEELLENETVDAFLIAAPLPERHRAVQAALYAACHVLVRFPQALTVRAAAAMQRVASENRRMLAVYDTCFFSKHALMLRWAVQEKIIGRLQFVLDTQFGNRMLSPNRCSEGGAKGHDLKHGGGILFRNAMHDFSFFRFVFGDIIDVQGQHQILERERVIPGADGGVQQRFSCKAEDTVGAQLRFANNASGVYLRSWCGRPPLQEHAFCVWGDRGTIRDKELFPEGHDPVLLEEEWKKNIGSKQLAARFPGNITDPLLLELISFFTAVHQAGDNRSIQLVHSAHNTLRDLAAAWAAAESHATGKRLLVSEIESLKTENIQKTINERWNIP